MLIQDENGDWVDDGSGYTPPEETAADQNYVYERDANGNVVSVYDKSTGQMQYFGDQTLGTSDAGAGRSSGGENLGGMTASDVANMTPAQLANMYGSKSTAQSLIDTLTSGKGLAALLGAGAGLLGANQAKITPVGYQGTIPKYEAVRQQIPITDTTRRPGSSGRSYFTDTQYVPKDNTAAAQAAATQQAQQIAAQNAANPFRQNAQQTTTPQQQETVDPGLLDRFPRGAANTSGAKLPEMSPELAKYFLQQSTAAMAAGGLTSLKRGSYLAGGTDGMADKINTTIDGKQPAKLSHGEFVVPADVVSHLGNGNSEAGAQRLYDMMDRIRKARTGSKKQGKQINPNKFLPR